jgi:hypothetical protein
LAGLWEGRFLDKSSASFGCSAFAFDCLAGFLGDSRGSAAGFSAGILGSFLFIAGDSATWAGFFACGLAAGFGDTASFPAGLATFAGAEGFAALSAGVAALFGRSGACFSFGGSGCFFEGPASFFGAVVSVFDDSVGFRAEPAG